MLSFLTGGNNKVDVQKMIDDILDKARSGQLTEEQAQAAIKKLLEEASQEAPRRVAGESAAEERIKSAAQKARNLA